MTDRDLINLAFTASERAYAPYSNFNVGAAVRLRNGIVVKGANQENAAFPSGLCAERTAAFAASATYPGEAMQAMAIVGGYDFSTDDLPCTPCGACRQVMAEYQTLAGEPMAIIMVGKREIWKFDRVDDILPFIFDSLK